MGKIFLLLLIIGITSCTQRYNTINSVEYTTNDNKETAATDSIRTEAVFTEFKTLYNELMNFKTKANFTKYGFSETGEYNKWLKRVEALNERGL